MLNARNSLIHAGVVGAVAGATLLCCAHRAVGQFAGWYGAAQGMQPLSAVSGPATTAVPRGPLARLVANPDSTNGLPPFALSDQSGAIQRYIEPVPGIDLEPYLDQVVVVRHDTGHTLLASQLELPQQPLYPMLGASDGAGETRPFTMRPARGSESNIEPAQFVDDDDATVQLLPDSEALPDGAWDASTSGRSYEMETTADPAGDGEYLAAPHGPMMDSPPLDCDTTFGNPHLSGPFFAPLGAGPGCEKCGQFHISPDCDRSFAGFGPPLGANPPQLCRYYANAEINLLRTHIGESAHGKLSEKYEPSPRVTVGFNETGKIDGRVRYWHYSQDTPILGGGRIDVDMDVLDIEGTNLLGSPRFELLMGGGLRLTGIDVTDANNDGAGADLIGMTMFAEGRTPLCTFQDGRIAWVFGGRLSILGGDWGGDAGNDFTGGPFQDDNLVVHEMHVGVVYGVRHNDNDFHARFGFEMQNWHSDAFSQNGGSDSISFLGPGIQVGAGF